MTHLHLDFSSLKVCDMLSRVEDVLHCSGASHSIVDPFTVDRCWLLFVDKEHTSLVRQETK